MLQERYRELLTAYVDGELSARQRRHVMRLLHRSLEARRLLQRLQKDSRELRGLPRLRLERDLSGAILQKITAASEPLPFRRAPRILPIRAYPVWISAAAAAAILLTVGIGSYAVFSVLGRPIASNTMAHVQPGTVAPAPRNNVKDIVHDDGATPQDAPNRKPDPERPPIIDLAHDKPTESNPVVVPEKDEPILTTRNMEIFDELKGVAPNLDLPTTFKLRDLEQDAARKKLLAELQKDAPLHLELPCLDGTHAFEKLAAVLKAHHVDLTIDATAQRRLGMTKSSAKTNYVFYSEDLTADDLGQLLKQLGADDKKEKTPFDALVVRHMTDRDHKELSDLLGLDPVATPAKETGPLGVDPRKPLSEQTAAQLAATLAGQGKPGAKPGTDHAMLAMPYNPVRPKHDSAEIKQFLQERKPLRTGALPILLVVRGPAA